MQFSPNETIVLVCQIQILIFFAFCSDLGGMRDLNLAFSAVTILNFGLAQPDRQSQPKN